MHTHKTSDNKKTTETDNKFESKEKGLHLQKQM